MNEISVMMPVGVPYGAVAFDIAGLEWWALLLLCLAAFAAGWIDAVIGGGGLIQLPALLLVPGLSPVQALATNKLASVFGTATSSITYARKLRPKPREVAPMAIAAFCAAIAGASLAASLPAEVFTPIIVIALIVVLLITLLKPSLGAVTRIKHTGKRRLLISLAIGIVIGSYDGLLGPGTGTFLVIALVACIGLNFLQASAQAKIVNFATNLGALVFFIPLGAVMWKLGISLAIANAVGGFLGARTAMSRGARYIRIVFVCVVTALIIKLGWDVFSG
ncbi:TSUP family transporter [Leucobacter chinensis]|uniref:TSUP family transporter n=1 Tax=Leucobacter chinensis TaxID=2851010 RepID=UPI0020B6B539|nr:TSUP family transporter [Leucobacter chinensis]